MIDSGHAWLPIFRCLDPSGNEHFWQDQGYGLVGVKKAILEDVGWVPEFQSWGGEDNLLHDALAKRIRIVRERRADLRHQWHPDELRDINYARPRFSDYTRLTSTPAHHGGEPSHRMWGNHSHWTGDVLLYSDGRMERPGVDSGDYVLAERERIVLNWDRWQSEELLWDAHSKVYRCINRDFTLRPQEVTYAFRTLPTSISLTNSYNRSNTSKLKPAEGVALRDLAEISQLLERRGVGWSLQGGNVLGLHRTGGFLPNECDVDIVILAEHWSREINQAALELGFKSRVHHQGMGDNGMHVIWQKEKQSWPIEVYPTHQACFFGQRMRYNGGDRYWRYYFPPHFIEETRVVDFLGVPVRIPAATEDYLRWFYGDQFHIPLGDDQWDWIKQPGARSWNMLHGMERPVNSDSQDFRPSEICSQAAANDVTRIYVDGVFDLFHWGHVELFRSARALAKHPYLIVGVCADEDVDYKPRPTMTFDERLRIVAACGLVDETVRGPVPVSNDFLKKMAIGLVVHGNDTSEESRRTWYSAAIELGIYREVPYTSNINTSGIRRRILNARPGAILRHESGCQQDRRVFR